MLVVGNIISTCARVFVVAQQYGASYYYFLCNVCNVLSISFAFHVILSAWTIDLCKLNKKFGNTIATSQLSELVIFCYFTVKNRQTAKKRDQRKMQRLLKICAKRFWLTVLDGQLLLVKGLKLVRGGGIV